MRRKGFSTGWWWGRVFSPSGVGDGSEKREAVILSRVCPGEGVLVRLFLCVIPCSSLSLLLCLCCNVLLLCLLLACGARCWLANCAGRVLHGSHCNALLSHYPLQERSPRAPPSSSSFPATLPLPSLPFHLSTPFFSLPFLSSCPPLHTHMQSGVNRAPPALSEQMGAAEDSRLVSLFPTLCTPFSLSTALFFLTYSPFRPV